jgi:hypothetical protein
MQPWRIRGALAATVSAALAVMSAQADGAAQSGGLLAGEAAAVVRAAPADRRAGRDDAMAEAAMPSALCGR